MIDALVATIAVVITYKGREDGGIYTSSMLEKGVQHQTFA